MRAVRLDDLLERIPAWRAFFLEPWSMCMSPEKHTQAQQLEQKHRMLYVELRAWQAQHQAPLELLPGLMPNQRTPVPIDLWLSLKNGMVQKLEAAIAQNRKDFEAL